MSGNSAMNEVMEKKEAIEKLLAQIRAARLPEPARDLRFHPMHPWFFDLCWPSRGIAAEVDGGEDQYGYTMYREAASLGWFLFHFTPDMVESGEALRTLRAVLRTI